MSGGQAWFRSGAPWVWLTAGAVSVCLIMVFGLLLLIASRGLGHFWPKPIAELMIDTLDGAETVYLGEIADVELVPATTLRDLGFEVPEEREFVERCLIKTGNRDVSGNDFTWVPDLQIKDTSYPTDAIVLEREEWGNFYGRMVAVRIGEQIVDDEGSYAVLLESIARKRDLADQIKDIEEDKIGGINYKIERLRLKERGYELKGRLNAERMAELETDREALDQKYQALNAELSALYEKMARDEVVMQIADGREVSLPVAKLVRATKPNELGYFGKVRHYFSKLGEFIFDEPREANTEGGVFPAIFGTVLMVMIMSVFVTPFGVVAAVYLREYAKQGPLTRMIRIAVNNLAGVPSVVYGVFGLGFFVYFLGGNIDRLFFPEALPAPTFGTPGILWSSLTLAILTVPVVIVATEEGLSRIPRSIREGSLALGATKAETLWRTVLPMATPAMMTGLILAVARAAGEVAPLMMVGVVKLAPSLATDGNFPFLHLDRKFMHLGFHIYDVGFQSPNVEAARPLVYATALLLVVIIVSLNLAAIAIRNRLREKYGAAES